MESHQGRSITTTWLTFSVKLVSLIKHWTLSMKFHLRLVLLVWECLLGACRIHANMELEKHAANHLLELERHQSGPYVKLSNIYVGASRWDDKAKIDGIIKKILERWWKTMGWRRKWGIARSRLRMRCKHSAQHIDHIQKQRKSMQSWWNKFIKWRKKGMSLIQNLCYITPSRK